MTWETRVDTRQNDMAHGITFVMNERRGTNVRAEAAVGPRKMHLDGTASLTLAFNQHKYGNELIAQLYTRGEHRMEDRRADGYNRVQIYLGPADLFTAAMLRAMADEIERRTLDYIN